MCVRERKREFERKSVFQKPLKRLKWVSEKIESVNAERRLRAGAKAILKDWHFVTRSKHNPKDNRHIEIKKKKKHKEYLLFGKWIITDTVGGEETS